ncbi:MAG: hypothetical protein C5B51_26180 [Terriglobia bacterium]|nr:MAG: hypothetical protein C5B51_26180 [Terriglobia bacterium]
MLAPLMAMVLSAQGRGGARPPQPPQTPKAAAPIDLTGYWVANITTDWRWRMTVPPKGDYLGMPLNPEGRKVADAWDPAKDEAAGEQCKSYGAPGILRAPGRIHITWQDDQTLKLETDAGQQVRTFYFGAPPANAGGDWQGVSQASWEMITGPGGVAGANLVSSGALKVVTAKLRPGYLRKNGVPYSANTTLTEYFDVIKEPNGDEYLVVSITAEDLTYLNNKYETAVNFKKQADNAGWNPTPCTSR